MKDWLIIAVLFEAGVILMLWAAYVDLAKRKRGAYDLLGNELRFNYEVIKDCPRCIARHNELRREAERAANR